MSREPQQPAADVPRYASHHPSVLLLGTSIIIQSEAQRKCFTTSDLETDPLICFELKDCTGWLGWTHQSVEYVCRIALIVHARKLNWAVYSSNYAEKAFKITKCLCRRWTFKMGHIVYVQFTFMGILKSSYLLSDGSLDLAENLRCKICC